MAARRGAFFVGLHGNFSGWLNTGLHYAEADATTHQPRAPTQPFVRGFALTGPVVGRVCDVLFAPD